MSMKGVYGHAASQLALWRGLHVHSANVEDAAGEAGVTADRKYDSSWVPPCMANPASDGAQPALHLWPTGIHMLPNMQMTAHVHTYACGCALRSFITCSGRRIWLPQTTLLEQCAHRPSTPKTKHTHTRAHKENVHLCSTQINLTFDALWSANSVHLHCSWPKTHHSYRLEREMYLV